jgi:hypothetical protein
MTDVELLKMARLAQRDARMGTGALYGALADHIKELEAKLLTAAEERGILLARIEAQEFTNADLLRALQGQKPAQPAPDVAALESDLSFMKACHGELAHQYKGLEARLAKAVGALQAFEDFDGLPLESKRPDVFEIKVRNPILAALAELKGEKEDE